MNRSNILRASWQKQLAACTATLRLEQFVWGEEGGRTSENTLPLREVSMCCATQLAHTTGAWRQVSETTISLINAWEVTMFWSQCLIALQQQQQHHSQLELPSSNTNNNHRAIPVLSVVANAAFRIIAGGVCRWKVH